MLSEREAWETLARLWENHGFDAAGAPWVMNCFYGLCEPIHSWRLEGTISKKTEQRMRNRIDKLPSACPLWKFELTDTGAKARVAFCRKMAKLCSRKRKA